MRIVAHVEISNFGQEKMMKNICSTASVKTVLCRSRVIDIAFQQFATFMGPQRPLACERFRGLPCCGFWVWLPTAYFDLLEDLLHPVPEATSAMRYTAVGSRISISQRRERHRSRLTVRIELCICFACNHQPAMCSQGDHSRNNPPLQGVFE